MPCFELLKAVLCYIHNLLILVQRIPVASKKPLRSQLKNQRVQDSYQFSYFSMFLIFHCTLKILLIVLLPFKYRVGYIVKVAILTALSIYLVLINLHWLI